MLSLAQWKLLPSISSGVLYIFCIALCIPTLVTTLCSCCEDVVPPPTDHDEDISEDQSAIGEPQNDLKKMMVLVTLDNSVMPMCVCTVRVNVNNGLRWQGCYYRN